MSKFIIIDWMSNVCFSGRDHCKNFASFDDAEEFLQEFLGNNYETDRQEYYIIEGD